ncbi:MAG TPA: glutamine synthetase family protein [Solirubrobacteraceae bacterium]|nr:glutamine synthetase family protein [Solirubrobacteraceae bacterium]
MSEESLVALVTCDLGAIVRGRSLPREAFEAAGSPSVGWVPANHALTPLGTLAEPNPFGSVGDLRLLADAGAHVRVAAAEAGEAGELAFSICDVVELGGEPWECCPRAFLRDALAALESELGLRVLASFEHEFQLPGGRAAELPFSLAAQRGAGAFPARAMRALREAGAEPERFMPEYASHQFEIPVAPAEGVAAADRAVVLREVVREVARREGARATFTPQLDPAEAGSGVHVHLSLLDAERRPALYDATRPGSLSELGGRFAAGILRHARALCALTAPSPVSGARLAPHHWGAGAVCLGPQNREALLRIPPLVPGPGEDRQLRLEYRAADAAANPYLALGAIVRAGLAGVSEQLDPAPLLERDPAELDGDEAGRHGVGALPRSLEQALEALEGDETVRGWMTPLMYEAYVAVKRSEVQAAAELDPEELRARYARAY